MKKKILALLMTSVLALSLTACASRGNASTSGSKSPSSVGLSQPAGDQIYTIGICQLAPHPALDSASQGFRDKLTEKLGSQVKFIEGNAGGEANNCIPIVDGFIAEHVDLILANATASLTAAASATDTIPILGTAITNYGVALNLDSTEDKVLGGNISWPPWTSRRRCSRSSSPTPKTWVWSTAPPSPTPCSRWRPFRATWRG